MREHRMPLLQPDALHPDERPLSSSELQLQLQHLTASNLANITQTELKHKISIINHLMISIQTFLLTILIPKT